MTKVRPCPLGRVSFHSSPFTLLSRYVSSRPRLLFQARNQPSHETIVSSRVPLESAGFSSVDSDKSSRDQNNKRAAVLPQYCVVSFRFNPFSLFVHRLCCLGFSGGWNYEYKDGKLSLLFSSSSFHVIQQAQIDSKRLSSHLYKEQNSYTQAYIHTSASTYHTTLCALHHTSISLAATKSPARCPPLEPTVERVLPHPRTKLLLQKKPPKPILSRGVLPLGVITSSST